MPLHESVSNVMWGSDQFSPRGEPRGEPINETGTPRLRTRGRLFRTGPRSYAATSLLSRIHPTTPSFAVVHEAVRTPNLSTLPEIVTVDFSENLPEKLNATTQTTTDSLECSAEHELVCTYVDALIAKGEEVPPEFICPITTFCMRDPVLAIDEFTYERSAITRWLQRASTSPMTRESMGGQILKSGKVVGNYPVYSNRALRTSTQRWAREHAKSKLDTSIRNVLMRV